MLGKAPAWAMVWASVADLSLRTYASNNALVHVPNCAQNCAREGP